MAENQQAFTGLAGLTDTIGEWNRLQFAIRSIIDKIASATLVLVRAVGSGTVDVQPLVSQVDGAGNAVPHGTIHALPIWQLQGGVSGIVLTPAVGDIGLAVFAHSDISAVKRSKAPNIPGSARKFDYADGIYLGGVLNAPPTQYIRMDDSGITINSLGPVVINAQGDVDVTASGKAVINATETDINSNLKVGGNIVATGTISGAGT